MAKNKVNIKMDFIDKLEADIKKLSHSVNSSLAHTMSKELEKEYNYVINNFYNEYTPKYYQRHNPGGLYKTYQRYYKNPHNRIYYGGIEITEDKMYDDYHNSRIDVLNSFLNGYHGHPRLGIYSSINTYDHMTRYRDFLSNHVNDYIPDALNEARKQKYHILKF